MSRSKDTQFLKSPVNQQQAIEIAARIPKNNLEATTNPTTNDDITAGYSASSLWFNSVNLRVFLCVNNSEGSADWQDLTSTATTGNFKGFWDASSNTPTLADGVGVNGDYYFVSTAGTQDLGSGAISFGTGDMVINSAGTWNKIPAQNLVTSVFGRQGVITAQFGDYNADQIDDSSTTNKFTNVTAINKLAGIEDGAEVNNISDSNASSLTGGDDTNLHHHDSRYYTESEVDDLVNAILPQFSPTDATGSLPSAEIEFFQDTDLDLIRARFVDLQPSGSINMFVDKNLGNNSYSGKTINRPKASIQSAIDAAPNGASFTIAPYQYNENIVLTAASANQKDNYYFEGKGSTGSFPCVIQGDLTISNVITRQRFRNIQFGTASVGGKIIIDGSEGRHYFDNVYFDNGIEAKNTFKRWHDFNDCSGKGVISLGETGTPASGCNFFFQNCDLSAVTDLRIGHSNITVILFNNRRLPQKITHTAGNLIIIPPATFESSNSTFLDSTCNSGSGKIVLWSGYNFMRSDNINFGRINKTGTCTIYLGSGIRDYTNDVINGTIVYLQKTNDLDTGLTPTNYNSSDSLLNNLLAGIDNKLGDLELPNQTGNVGKVLSTDGNNLSWESYFSQNNLAKEEVSGTKDGVNKTFSLSYTPITNSLSLYLNGQLLLEGLSKDYTLSGLEITLTDAPSSGESVYAIYLKL